MVGAGFGCCFRAWVLRPVVVEWLVWLVLWRMICRFQVWILGLLVVLVVSGVFGALLEASFLGYFGLGVSVGCSNTDLLCLAVFGFCLVVRMSLGRMGLVLLCSCVVVVFGAGFGCCFRACVLVSVLVWDAVLAGFMVAGVQVSGFRFWLLILVVFGVLLGGFGASLGVFFLCLA